MQQLEKYSAGELCKQFKEFNSRLSPNLPTKAHRYLNSMLAMIDAEFRRRFEYAVSGMEVAPWPADGKVTGDE